MIGIYIKKLLNSCSILLLKLNCLTLKIRIIFHGEDRVLCFGFDFILFFGQMLRFYCGKNCLEWHSQHDFLHFQSLNPRPLVKG